MNDMHEAQTQTLMLSAYSQWNKTGIRGWNASQRNLRLDNHYTASELKNTFKVETFIVWKQCTWRQADTKQNWMCVS